MRFAAALALAALALSPAADAAVTVAQPLMAQLPQIAHVGQPYTWAFSDATFASDVGAAISYAVQGLPQWAHFDEASRTFSGSPAESDEGQARITVEASEPGSAASAAFNLLVLSQAAPVLHKPIAEQLPEASSLGIKNILPGNQLHLPLGWSFSIGFAGDTFTQPDGDNVYWTAQLAGNRALPSWMTWDANSYTLWGVAPTSPGPEGEQFDFVLTGSNRRGYGGVSSSMTVVVSSHELTLGGPLRAVNITAGDNFRYRIPTTGLQLDGRQSPESNTITTHVEASQYSWLAYDAETNTVSGKVPFDAAQGDPSQPQSLFVPLTFHDTHNNSLPANLTLAVYPSAFNVETLPNIFIEPGHMFNQSLAGLLRNPAVSKLNITYDPPSASAWLSLDDDETHLLAGKPPAEASDDRVKVSLVATNGGDSDRTSSATFFLAANGDTPPAGDSGAAADGDKPAGGLSSRGKLALIASLGAAGGLVGLIILMVICRRCCAVESHDTSGVMADDAYDEERTLHDEKSPRFAAAAWGKKKGSDSGHTPSTLTGGSPWLDPKSAAAGNKSSVAWDGMPADFVDHHVADGRTSPAMNDAYTAFAAAEAVSRANEQRASPERAVQHSIMGAMPWGKKKRAAAASNKSLAREAALNSAIAVTTSATQGLGLNTGDDAYASSPSSSARHSRSRHSGLSTRSGGNGTGMARPASWEDDMWYEQPTRRGGTETAKRSTPMRHRNSHINASPLFSTGGFQTGPSPAAFATTSVSGDGHSTDHEADTFEDSQGTGDADQMEAVEISQARRVDLRQPSSTFARAVSGSVDPMDANAAFEDAEDEEGTLNGHDEGTYGHTGRAPNRESAMSNMTQDFRVLQPHLTFPDHAPTMRAVNPSASPPPTPSPFDAPFGVAPTPRPASIRTSSHRVHQPQLVEVSPRRHTLFTMHPNPPPALRGAPDSPGKRSGSRRQTYHLIVLDESMPQFHGQWPAMLSEWLSFNERTFEVSGMPPDGLFDEEDLDGMSIALVLSTQRAPPSPALGPTSPPSPSKRGHGRSWSNDGEGEELEVVARAFLRFNHGRTAFHEVNLGPRVY
jgi:axial budding pattern protein 2